MKKSTMGLYWKVIAYGSIVGIFLAVGVLAIYYLTFAHEFTWATVGDSIRWGFLLGLLTAGMVIAGTCVTARRLDTAGGKGMFILLSFLSPLVGWLLLGALNGVLVGWDFFFFAPWIAGVSSVTAVLIGALSTFLMPRAHEDEPPAGHSLDELF